MEDNSMRTGLWDEYEEQHNGDDSIEWSDILEAELSFSIAETGCFAPYPDFMHGSCDIFAEELSRRYGYRIECVSQYIDEEMEESELVHAYCVAEMDGTTYYIDARGANSDYDEFMQEFYDLGFWDNDDSSFTEEYDLNSFISFMRSSKDSSSIMDLALRKEYGRAAGQVIADYPDYYDIGRSLELDTEEER